MTDETILEEISLEHDVDAVLGLVTAEGAEGASLLDEAGPFVDRVGEGPDDEDGDDVPPRDDDD